MAVAALALGGVAAACGERLEGGAACPILCPQQNVSVLDTVFDAIALDSAIAGYPPFGTEPSLLLGSRGDTLDTRPVIRFDSLNAYFHTASGDSAVQKIDSAYVLLHLDKAHSQYSAPVTLEVFDVDTTEADTVTSLELGLFRPDRRIARVTLDTSQIKDSVRVRLDSARVMASIIDRRRLRLGFRATSSAGLMLQIISNEGGSPAILRYDASRDTTVGVVSVTPNTQSPRRAPLSEDYVDYLLIAKAPAAPVGPFLPVGGLPGYRTYLRFDIPSRILDSSTVLRATLILTQHPNRTIDPTKALTLYPQLVTAGKEITDVARSALLIAPAGVGFDSLSILPGDSGLVNIEIVNALRTWALTVAATSQRAIVLRSPDEGIDPRRVIFFSTEAAAALRPRLRVNYSPRSSFGVP